MVVYVVTTIKGHTFQYNLVYTDYFKALATYTKYGNDPRYPDMMTYMSTHIVSVAQSATALALSLSIEELTEAQLEIAQLRKQVCYLSNIIHREESQPYGHIAAATGTGQ